MAVVTHVGRAVAGLRTSYSIRPSQSWMIRTNPFDFDSFIQRSDWNAALSSNVNSSGCSHAAKWPPFAARL